MTDLIQPGNGQTAPLERTIRTIIKRCDELGLVVVDADGPLETEGVRRAGVLRDAAWLAELESTIERGGFGMPWPGIGVLRIEVHYRAYDPRTLFIHSFDDPAAADWSAAPVPRPNAEPVAPGVLAAMAPTIRWMVGDLLEAEENRHDIDDLSDQLGDAFETLDLLYTFGRAMTDLAHPEKYIAHVCERLRETLGFGYVAVHVPEGENAGGEIAGKTLWSGTPGDDEMQFTLDRLVGVMAKLGELSDTFRGPQAVVRPLNSDRGLAGIILAGDKHAEGGNVSSYDTKLIDAAVGFLSTFLTNSRLYDEQRRLVMGVLESLSAAIDAKDPYTRGHSQRVAWVSKEIALSMGLGEDAAERLRIAGLLHDVGKIGVPESVLQKPGKLTDDEFGEIKRHPEVGYRILKDLAGLEDVLPAVLHHHERIDGRGYPHGLESDQIPLHARIVACADTFDAMSSTRSYREKMPRDVVLAEMQKSAGTQLDPEVVGAFMRIDLAGFDALLDEVARASSPIDRAA